MRPSRFILGAFLGLFLVSLSGAVTFVRNFDVAETASGLAYNGESMWIGHIGDPGDEIWRITDHDGTVLDTLAAPARGCYGLAWFGNMVWYLNDSPTSSMYALNAEGQLVYDWELPHRFMSGIAYHDGEIWVCSYHDPAGRLFRLDPTTGEVLGDLVIPYDQPKAVTWQDSLLWIADSDGMVYQLHPETMEELDSFESPGGEPKGLHYDGRWLWLLDEGPHGYADRIYLLDSSAPIPRAVITPQELDFGAIEIGSDSTITVQVFNDGPADLRINQLNIRGNPTGYQLEHPGTPIIIPEYQTGEFTLTFDPPQVGFYNGATVYLTTNDHHHSYVELPVYGVGGYATQTFHNITQADPMNFGTVRMQQELDAMVVRYFVFTNLGAPLLTIRSFESTHEDFFASRDFPFQLEGGQRDSLAIWFLPRTAGQYNESFTLSTSDPRYQQFTMGLTGYAREEEYTGGTVLWSYYNNAEEWEQGFAYITEISDIAGTGFPAVLAVTSDGEVYAFNSNAHENAQILYQKRIQVPGVRGSGFTDETGYLSRKELATTIEDINGDGCVDVIVSSEGYLSGGDIPNAAGVVVALSGVDGEQLWLFNTRELGSAPVMEVATTVDFDGDHVQDVMVVLGANEYGVGPRKVIMLDGETGAPIWFSRTQADYKTAIVGEDFNGDGIPEVFAGTSSSLFYCFDGASGYPIWAADPNGGTFKAIMIDDVGGSPGKDLLISTGQNLVALDPANGEEIWANDAVRSGVQMLSVGYMHDVEDEQVFVGRSSGEINGIYTSDGTVAWTRNVTTAPLDMKLIRDLDGNGVPEVAIGTYGNLLTVIEGDGVDARWSYSEGGENRSVTSVAMVEDVEGNYSAEVIACTRRGNIRLHTGGLNATSVNDEKITILPTEFAVRAAYPNPFNGRLRLVFDLPAGSTVPVGIYDVLGRRVHRMMLNAENGRAQTIWAPGNGLASGTYIIRIENVSAETAKVLYVK